MKYDPKEFFSAERKDQNMKDEKMLSTCELMDRYETYREMWARAAQERDTLRKRVAWLEEELANERKAHERDNDQWITVAQAQRAEVWKDTVARNQAARKVDDLWAGILERFGAGSAETCTKIMATSKE